jgi:hypothetical protein
MTAEPPEDERGPEAGFRTAWWQRLLAEASTYELTRFAILRLLSLVYFVAFLILALQYGALLGPRGLLPIGSFLRMVHQGLGAEAYWRFPTIFWISDSEGFVRAAYVAGLVLSVAALGGVTNAFVQIALWILYMSFVHVGQIFYGYGWEIQLLETGFLSVFLCPVRSARPLPTTAAPKIVIWLFRWLIFRIMVGAALIKLRGDECWRDLTCLDYHFETQPNPNPLAWSMHHAPHAVHAAGVLFNHFAELIAPWFAFGFRRWRHAAGLALVAFQVFLILSGNLSFLNWLTIVPALACFDDTALARLVPGRFAAWRDALLSRFELLSTSRHQKIASIVLGLVVLVLSAGPVINLFSSRQAMNRSFDPFDLVNTYGAFGGVDQDRHEVILEGTSDAVPDDSAHWQEYELPCQPGDVRRRPCIVSPYHYRLDWQMWFVGNGAWRGEDIEQEPWLVHLVWQLLQGDPTPKSLLAHDPFPDTPPRWIRAGIWQYRFTQSRDDGAWWTRERVGEYLNPLSLESRPLRAYVSAFGWRE